MWNIFQIQLRLGLLIATLGLVVSCLITNCPRGGKRAKTDDAPEKATCVSCGPEGQGVCLGRSMCCGRGIGCLGMSRYTEACRGVRSFKTSCLAELVERACGARGKCKTKYICCSNDHCTLDMSCNLLMSKMQQLYMYNNLDGPALASFHPHSYVSFLPKDSQPQNNLQELSLTSAIKWKPTSKEASALIQSDYES